MTTTPSATPSASDPLPTAPRAAGPRHARPSRRRARRRVALGAGLALAAAVLLALPLGDDGSDRAQGTGGGVDVHQPPDGPGGAGGSGSSASSTSSSTSAPGTSASGFEVGSADHGTRAGGDGAATGTGSGGGSGADQPGDPGSVDPDGPGADPSGDGADPTADPDPGGDQQPGDPGEDGTDDGPDVPPDDDPDPGPWSPPPLGPQDFAPNPLIFDLVAEVKPELDGGKGQAGHGFAADVGCSANCFDKATASVLGTEATFDIRTDTNARIWVILDGGIGSKDSGNTLTKHFAPHFEGLTPDTTYHVTLVAEDVHGRAQHRYGEIHTMRRKAQIAFTSIKVLDDADHGINRGEVEWFFRVAGNWLPQLHHPEHKHNSGDTITLHGDPVVVLGSGRFVEVATQGVEHDCCHFCAEGIPPFSPAVGGDVGECLDVASTWDTIDLDHLWAPAGQALPGEWANYEFSTQQHHLKYRVGVAVRVTYVP